MPLITVFIIAGVTATNKDKVKRVFRKAKVNYLKHNPDVLLDIKSEIKGSQMSIEFKDYVLVNLFQNRYTIQLPGI